MPELGRGLIELLDPVRGDRILDLGCGDGELAMALAARGCRVIGVDRSAAFVAAARRRGVAARVVDARRLAEAGLAAGSFDGVFSNAVLHWIL
ncbi:MAG: methyltransferase domain-containing protein, partial [Spirochaetaceae bacterium]|nr:methyltransferase domain-containing protein [Spirochaetaceae bacterium]